MQRIQANNWYLLSKFEGCSIISRLRKWTRREKKRGKPTKIQNRTRYRRADLEFSSNGKYYGRNWKLLFLKRPSTNFRQDASYYRF